ncbi:MAG: hypothetical protein PVF91_08440 [Chromatiales bacterium]|jgi:vacuolar-type H+-ATPase subunit E/Vma4
MKEDDTKALLSEIRDAQRALEQEYRRVANESLELQRQAFALQQQSVETQRTAVEQQGRSVAVQMRFARWLRVVLALAGAALVVLVLLAVMSF